MYRSTDLQQRHHTNINPGWYPLLDGVLLNAMRNPHNDEPQTHLCAIRGTDVPQHAVLVSVAHVRQLPRCRYAAPLVAAGVRQLHVALEGAAQQPLVLHTELQQGFESRSTSSSIQLEDYLFLFSVMAWASAWRRVRRGRGGKGGGEAMGHSWAAQRARCHEL